MEVPDQRVLMVRWGQQLKAEETSGGRFDAEDRHEGDLALLAQWMRYQQKAVRKLFGISDLQGE